MHTLSQPFDIFVICSRESDQVRLTAEQSTKDQPYAVVIRQCLVLQCDVLPSSVANATLPVNNFIFCLWR